MNNIITEQQARAITGGRMPLVPVEYETVIKALVACSHIDEAKYWSDKADALAAWAKIYRNDEVGVEAKRLKLHAYRRMDELAKEIARKSAGKAVLPARRVSPKSVLIDHGFSTDRAELIRRVGTVNRETFAKLVNSPRPPSPYALSEARILRSESWASCHASNGLSDFRSWCRRHNPKELARGLVADEVKKASPMLLEIQEWLDEFEMHLHKDKST